MSSNLKVNTILPSTGDTVSIAGIASITSSVSIASSCTASTFFGSGANLTGITQTTINNNANNRVITGSGTANTLEGESSFTYDGNGMAYITGTGAAGISSISLTTSENIASLRLINELTEILVALSESAIAIFIIEVSININNF